MHQLSLLWRVTILLLLTSLPSALTLDNRHRREVIVKYHGAVATDDGRCSQIGRDILQRGGNAVDASVAAALCLGVVSPASSGIGGGAFMVVRLADGTAKAFDMRETAPFRADPKIYAENPALKAQGPLSVGIPGEILGLYTAWKQHGKLPWEILVKPAMKLAWQGFKISPYLFMQMTRTESDILADKGLTAIFASKGKLKQTGDLCFNKKLALTLKKVSKEGPKAFYNGSVGVDLVRDIQDLGGNITMKDLQTYQIRVRKPLSSNVLGYKILGMPPPSSGGASMMLILNILAQYGVPSNVSASLEIHRLIEALKHTFAVRMNLGDPDFSNGIETVVSDMLSPIFAEKLKKTINDNKTFNSSYYGGRWNQIIDHGTSHVSIVDHERNAVSMTNTINGYFGARILSPRTGIVLNNEMDDFSVPPKTNGKDTPPAAPANFIRPGKRPLSSMTPTIVLQDDKVKAVVGASGGAMIIAGTTEVFMNHFFKKMDPFSSVMAPRVYHQLIPNRVMYENWTSVTDDHFEVPADIRLALKKKGHVLESLVGGTICQFVVQDLKANNGSGKLVAVSDPRKGGFPAGF